MNNYAEYTANCQKRIADLATMMERVRQEKLKLIENSLSSGEFGHFTEYKEIAVPGKAQDAPTTSASDLKDSPSQREDPASEEINNILQKQTRPFGVSKDSGISILSRPMTSSDFRDSPDVRVTSEERENTFQPILKDIPKLPRMKVTPESGPTKVIADVSQLIKEQEAAAKKQKPPLSLNRFSPHLEKPHKPHELSTIAEVETPSASKVNLNIEESGIGAMESFPNFEEYARKMQENAAADLTPMFPQLKDMMTVLDDVKVKSFLDPRDYGLPEISREHEQTMSRASSASSIVDILDELKRRQLVTEEFRSDDDDAGHTTPTATKQIIQQPNSPRRKPAQSRIIIKTPDNVVVEIQQDPAMTPTKRRPEKEHHEKLESPKSNDTLSGIQEIEKEPRDDLDLQGMGLNWAASMMKRDGQSKKLESSSSSSSIEKGSSIQIEIETNKSSTCDRSSSSSSTAGMPMNLREFLTRELTKRSLAEKSMSDESSLSSQFMRSLLNASTGPGTSSGNASDHDKLRTSTPVHTKGSSSQFATQKSGGNSLFPGDSLSTLKGSDRDSDKSNEKERRESN
jgi:anastral spindle 1